MSGAFAERGYQVVKGLLGPGEVEASVRHLERLSGRTREDFGRCFGRGLPGGVYGGWTLPDGVSKTPAFWDIVTRPALVEAVRGLLGKEARFLQHTDLHVGFSAVTWHRDSVNRRFGEGPDWDESTEPYRLLRISLYLQSFAQSRFALGVVPGSHRPGQALSEREQRAIEQRASGWRQATRLVTGRDPLAPWASWLETEPGDAILFDPRILHAGSFIRGPKYSLFLAYGVPGRHFARHRRYYRHLRRELDYAPLAPELVERLRKADLLAPEEEGEVDALAFRPSRLHSLLGRHVRPPLRESAPGGARGAERSRP